MLQNLILDTWYVCIPVIFALAVLDPALTILSYRRYRKTLAKRVDMERFELNPRWQKAVKAGRFLPLSYLIRVALSLVVLAVFFILPEAILGPDPSPRRALVGYLLCTFLIIDLNHLGNLRSFGLRRKEPEESQEKPKVRLGYSYSLGLTQVSYETTFLLLLVLWLVTGGYFLFGAAMAPLMIAYRLRFMRKVALRKEEGFPPRSYRSLRLAVLLAVIAGVLLFLHFHRTRAYQKHHLQKGNSFLEKREYDAAAGEFARSLRYVPFEDEAYAGLINSLVKAGRGKDAEGWEMSRKSWHLENHKSWPRRIMRFLGLESYP